MLGSTSSVTEASDVEDEDATPERPWVLARGYRQAVDRLPRVPPAAALAGSWALAGFLFGLALGKVFFWSAASSVVVALLCAALAWLGRGLTTVLVAGCAVLGALSIVYYECLLVWPDLAWGMSWLWPVALIATVVAVWGARASGAGTRVTTRLTPALIELAGGGGAFFLAWVCATRVSTNTASSIILSSEDNDAWLNTVATLRDGHGTSAMTHTAVVTFGPVADGYLAFVRSAVGGVLPSRVPTTMNASAVLAGHVLLVVLSSVVAALLARRTIWQGRPVVALLAWGVCTSVLASYFFMTPTSGFLTAALGLVLVLVAASILPPTSSQPRSVTSIGAWVACALVIFAAGSSWVPLVPLAGVVLAALFLGLAIPAVRRGPWPRVAIAACLGVVVAVLELALLRQYGDVVSPVGGGKDLLAAGGATPETTQVMLLLGLGLAGASWLLPRPEGGVGSTRPSYSRVLLWLLGYIAVVYLADAWVTHVAAHYGSLKLLFMLVAALVLLGTVEVLASPLIAKRPLESAAIVVVAVLFAATMQQGPLYSAAASHWPHPLPLPGWLLTVDRQIGSSQRVVCLGLTPKPDEGPVSIDAYSCSRYASSAQGRDDTPAGNWRFVQLGRLPVAKGVSLLHRGRWRLILVGDPALLHKKDAWYAPLVRQPGVSFVPVS